jgi:hypothetical protein
MATVLFKRGDNTEMDDTPIKDGLLFFNTEDNKIYMDNGNQRKQFGGGTDLIDNPTDATEQNAFSASGSLDLFLQKTTVVDTKANALAVTQNYIPLGCLAFKEMLGTTNYANVGDGTVSGALVSLRGETLNAVLAIGETTLVLNSSILTSNSYIDVYTDDWAVTPSSVVSDATDGTITLTFSAQSATVSVKVVVRNM